MKKWVAGALLFVAGLCWLHKATVKPSPVRQGLTHHLAPADTYYFLSYFSSGAPNGWIGWTPGAEVRRVKGVNAGHGSTAVTDGKHTAIVPNAFLTRDIETAEALEFADQRMQMQAESAVAAIRAESRAREVEAQIALARSIERANALQVAASMIGTYNSRLGVPAYPASGAASAAGYNGYYASYSVADARNGAAYVPAALPAAGTTASLVLPPVASDSSATALNDRLYSNGAKLGLPEGTLRQMALDISHSDTVAAYQ